MRILLVRPRRRKQAITLGEFMFSEPLGLECVSTVLKDKYEVKILDLMAENEDFSKACQEWQPQVVGFTSLCVDVLGVRDLAKKAKNINKAIITVVGGTQTFLAAENFFCPEIDHIMKFTTKANLLELLGSLEKKIKVPLIDGIYSKENNYQGTGRERINEYIIPDREATLKYRRHYSYFGFKPCALLQTSRGCSSICNFCLRWKLEGSREKDEPLEEIIEQIRAIKEASIMIIDNNFLYNQSRLEEFCNLLEHYKIKKNFICYGSVESIIKHETTLQRFKKNGLKALLVGYESFSEMELKSYNKKANREENIQASRILKELGIDCWASFILHPDWNIKDFRECRKFLKILAPQISSLVPLTPFPGSNLFQKYQDRLLFSPKHYDQWSFSIVSIRPSQMSLRRYYYEVLKTNFYVNLLLNNSSYLVSKFGYGTVLRVLRGSFKFFLKYLELMLKG